MVSVSHIDRLFSGSRSRGVTAGQAVDVVTVEFTPAGRSEPVVAVDVVDRGSPVALHDRSPVNLSYEAMTPRHAQIDGAMRTFPSRNFAELLLQAGLCAGVLIVILVLGAVFGRRKAAARAS